MIDFESLFAAIPSPYMVLDAKLNYVAVNKAYEAVVKLPAERIVGSNLFELFPNDGEEGHRLKRSIETVLETGRSDTIAFIPYAIRRPEAEGGGVEQRYWTAVHTPLKNEEGLTAFVLQNTVDVTDLVQARIDAGGVPMLQRAREAERAYQESLAESAEFRRLFTQAPGMIAILEGADHLFSFANDAYRNFTGNRSLNGRAVRDVFPEVVDQGFVGWLDSVYQTGMPQKGEGIRVLLQDVPEGCKREAFIDFHYEPIRDGEGRITGVFVQGTDRTDQYRTLQRQRLLLDELNHRVKNTLSTVQSIARRSFRNVDNHGLDAFESRIRALSNVHDIISDQHWEKIGLGPLLQQELTAFGASRFAMAGPDVELTPRAAIALAMAFHELASNAIKYGVFSGDDGALAVAWTILPADGEPHLSFEWKEIGNLSQPRDWSRGFGMRTLDRIVKGELGGDLDLDLEPTGFICRLGIALAEVGEVAG